MTIRTRKKFYFCFIFLLFAVATITCFTPSNLIANAMPFYRLNPKDMVLRAKFYTSYPSSTEERKHNICLAAKALDNTLVDVGGEFSFNRVVGERTEKRGYKQAKIIVDGEFVDGVGGGVCQVSTTLYNAVILAGLLVTEYHPHSLPVSYVAPSFDAMVNSGWADLRFINVTDNPIIIKTTTDGATLTVFIYGEEMQEKYLRKSVITGEIPPPEDKIIDGVSCEYEHLYEGQFERIKYGKAGLTSEGFVLVIKDGKLFDSKKIRSDKYNPTRGVLVKGVKPLDSAPSEDFNEDNNAPIINHPNG